MAFSQINLSHSVFSLSSKPEELKLTSISKVTKTARVDTEASDSFFSLPRIEEQDITDTKR